MRARYSSGYFEDLFAHRDYRGLVDISGVICSCSRFKSEDAVYGLPLPLFAYVESLLWFASSARSGVWTYFEATPEARQKEMVRTLEKFAPFGFAVQYERGIRYWRDTGRQVQLDQWLASNDERNNEW